MNVLSIGVLAALILSGCASAPRQNPASAAQTTPARDPGLTLGFSPFKPKEYKYYLVYQCDESTTDCWIPVSFDETPTLDNLCGIRAPRIIEFRRPHPQGMHAGTNRILWYIRAEDFVAYRFRGEGIDIRNNLVFPGEPADSPALERLFDSDAGNTTIFQVAKFARGRQARLSVYDIHVKRLSDNKDCEFGPLIVNIG